MASKIFSATVILATVLMCSMPGEAITLEQFMINYDCYLLHSESESIKSFVPTTYQRFSCINIIPSLFLRVKCGEYCKNPLTGRNLSSPPFMVRTNVRFQQFCVRVTNETQSISVSIPSSCSCIVQ